MLVLTALSPGKVLDETKRELIGKAHLPGRRKAAVLALNNDMMGKKRGSCGKNRMKVLVKGNEVLVAVGFGRTRLGLVRLGNFIRKPLARSGFFPSLVSSSAFAPIVCCSRYVIPIDSSGEFLLLNGTNRAQFRQNELHRPPRSFDLDPPQGKDQRRTTIEESIKSASCNTC